MRDVVFVAVTVGFFGVAAAVVRLCDRIVGPDPVARSEGAGTADVELVR